MEDQETSFPTKLKRLLTFLTEALSEVKPPFLRDLKLHAPASFERIESVRQKLIPLHLGRLVAEGKRHGMIRPDLQDKVLIELMCGLAQSVINPEVVTRLGVSLREAFETVFRTIFVGIMTVQGRRVYEESQKIMGR